MTFLRTYLLLIKSVLLIAVIVAFFACTTPNNQADNAINFKLQQADSLYIAGSNDSALRLLKQIRSHISIKDPLICSYYNQMSEYSTTDPAKKGMYADSSLAFFNYDDHIKKHPEIYYKSLLTKGDASLKAGEYVIALNYYYKAKEILSTVKCDNGEWAAKMGMIYYGQQNYALAAKYWAESYRRLGMCDIKITAEKMFFLKQGALNNAGYSYQQAGMIDSANYYYLKDMRLIDETATDSLIKNHYINASRAVLFDNLGGVNLLRGNLIMAESYLLKSISFYGDSARDGAKIPPYIKLAQLYLKTGDYVKAEDAFKKSKQLLDLYWRDNPESLIAWNKFYSEYLLKQNKPLDAYQYQNNYIRLKDSINKGLVNLYRLDVEREINTIQQRQSLTDFRQKSQIRKIYLAGIGIIGLLFVVILILIYRTLKKTRKNNKFVTMQNHHLNNTLVELERVNTNYIRIMRVMAHDLRNPLSGMSSLAAMLHEDDDFSDDNKQMLRLIETTGIHSLEMINELLKTGLADENEKIVMQSIDLTSLLYDSVELLQFKANDKEQKIEFISDNTPIFSLVNHEKMWRVINNLVVNAIKFSHIGDTIKVSIKRIDGKILISVADTGVGIPPEHKETVFEMFTPAKKPGTDGEQPFGLGLSISKRIIDLHNGQIWFENNKEKGTIFYIQLPGTHASGVN